ncbi:MULTISPECIES: hypothetical protein [Leeuwenhoekiella]|jgi:hypothetical protein|uniref:Uncharacterized protein n=1 Tax=Leeuwenhoekiella blandensis (strain CECT 7118 / CCUG 51940 / KCTC 22103 / MED217) TaxID=398720 RepID=A3XRC3_LEEBM|nr:MULTISPECIES: hypothetical protein [Leeuwenhoekiella]EAQ47904.1 hypothetical protein MED217_18701 [Leeuwenhoekiella blandensis MED217]MAO44084.1 hypothetical protein [Leeuwenhoekiella sp.]MBQ51568.1 hypothetical protein [Leeuwenhoekiella sp.]HBT08296.1 hypothetical protein [Leeuwenhoekiella sp.]|tara:strand:+ start:6994 stop:7395 length:402 start_codon:yes stop_codon:yes gene_type:complete
MKRIKFYKTFSTSNLLILGVILLTMGFSSYKILFSETENVSTYVIINSLFSVLLIIYSYRKQKAHWVQYDQKRINLKLAGVQQIIKRKAISKIKVNGKSIEILFKASPGLVLDLESYATEDVLLFENILKNNN